MRKKLLSKAALTFAVAACTLAGGTFTSLADTEITPEPLSVVEPSEDVEPGFKEDDQGIRYMYEDGTYAINTWVSVDEGTFYFDETGYMVTGWQVINGKDYYFAPGTGVMQTGWTEIKGKWYYFKETGAMQTGWAEIKGKWYYFKETGAIQTR